MISCPHRQRGPRVNPGGCARSDHARRGRTRAAEMMTVAAIIAGLLPILWSHLTGSELMQRIAVLMIGGMVSSTVLTLVVIPTIYATVKG